MNERDVMNPNAQTHIPVVVVIPADETMIGDGRAYMQPPTLWREGVEVVHKVSSRRAVVYKIALDTMQFRPYWPDEKKHAGRTEWESCKDWIPQTKLHPNEIARREAQQALQAQMDALDAKEVAAVSVLVDGDDPKKGLAKIEALRALGVIKSPPAAVAAAVEEKAKPAPKRAPTKVEPA